MDNPGKHRAGFVAVIGRPNVGKSTLINSLLGQKIAAVTSKPQTTRRQQLGILSLEQAQILFIDTPGIHEAKHKLGECMNEEAMRVLGESDVVLFMVDGSVTPQSEDKLIADTILIQKRNLPILMVVNKIDKANQEDISANIDDYQGLLPQVEMMQISAKKGSNLMDMIEWIINKLPEHPPLYSSEQITDLYEREIAADLIREAGLMLLRDEVPHGIAVRIDNFTERGERGAYIEATVFVERETQKGIVVGKNGEMIKQISIKARQEIEKMSGRSVFLKIRVKVKKKWRNDDGFLLNFGFRNKVH